MDGDEEIEGEDDVTPELDTETEETEVSDDEVEGDEDETEGGDGKSEEPSQAAEGDKVSRRTARVQKLEKERDEKAAEAERYRNELETLKANASRPVTQEDRAAEEAKLAAMEPIDRVAYIADRQIRALQSQIQGLGFQTQDSADKALFEARATNDKLYAKYKDRVEASLKGMRDKGLNTNREAILTYLIGEDARKRAAQSQPGDQRRKAAASRLESARSKPTNVRSDASSSRGEKSLEDKLRGVQI